MKAWLITWEWLGNAAAMADKVAGILNSRWREERVAEIVEFLYSNTNSIVSELANYARQPKNNPYRSIVSGGRINCGHNPFLYARKVSDLIVTTDHETYLESITWKEPPIYKFVDGHNQMIKEPVPQEFKRRIEGRLLHKCIFDRLRGRFYEGWGPDETPDGPNW